MRIKENYEITNISTFKIKTFAKYYCEAQNVYDLKFAINFAKEKNIEFEIIGGGSNTIFANVFVDKLIIKNKVETFTERNEYYDSTCDGCTKTRQYKETDISIKEDINGTTIIKVASGINWDYFVNYVCQKNYFGVENLAFIPGTVGGAVVQNIAAYGGEIAEVVKEVEVLNTETLQIEILKKEKCEFVYRNSIFKNNKKYFVLSTIFLLSKINKRKMYKEVEVYLESSGEIKNLPGQFFKIEGDKKENNFENLNKYTAIEVVNAVTEIRKSKLPDVEKFPNVGSFFKNPIIEKEYLNEILKKYPNIIYHEMEDGKVKIGAGRMLEILGFKNYKYENGNFGTYEKHALSLIHFNKKGDFAELEKFIKLIKEKVKKEFEIDLEEEVVVIK